MDGTPIRIVIVDEHAVIRAGLRAVLGTAPDLHVIAEASSAGDAVGLAGRLAPDVIVMDMCDDPVAGTAAIRTIVAMDPAPRVLILTLHRETSCLAPAMAAGARGFLAKCTADRDLVEAVRAIARGDAVRGAGVRHGLHAPPAHAPRQPAPSDRAGFDRLTERERDVLTLVAAGYTAPEIGMRLVISPKTVDTYKQRIHGKIGLSHRAEYVKMALRLGLLTH